MDVLIADGAASKGLIHTLVKAVFAYEAAHEGIFTHCVSNGLFNAWQQPMDVTALNDAHEGASRALARLAGGAADVLVEMRPRIFDALQRQDAESAADADRLIDELLQRLAESASAGVAEVL